MSGNKLPEPSPRTTKLSGPTDFKVNIYLHQLSENASHSSKTKTKPQVNKTGHSPAGTRCRAGGRCRPPSPRERCSQFPCPSPAVVPPPEPPLGCARGYNQSFVILFAPSVSS